MKSHFTLSSRNLELTAPSARVNSTGRHFRLSSGAALVCAVSGLTAMMTDVSSAQYALDRASGSTYAGGWAAGQNGGFGFGAWSFNGTTTPGGVADPGGQQGMSSAQAIGTAWTMYNLGTAPPSGISDTGRGINGGLGIGQTFETVIQNPVGYHFFGGFDINFYNGTDNLAAGNNAAAIRVSQFNYYTSYPNWNINDSNPGITTSLSSATTAISGMKLDLYLASATSYILYLDPLSNPSQTYTYFGTYSGPINYVNFRLYDGLSGGLNDTANNFGISYMEVVPEPSSLALIGLGVAGILYWRRRK